MIAPAVHFSRHACSKSWCPLMAVFETLLMPDGDDWPTGCREGALPASAVYLFEFPTFWTALTGRPDVRHPHQRSAE